MSSFVYMLRCGDGSLYTGWTNDLKRRLSAHCAGRGGRYTSSHRPVCLVYYECQETKQLAMKREYQIKQLARAQKEKLIRALPDENRERIREINCAVTGPSGPGTGPEAQNPAEQGLSGPG